MEGEAASPGGQIPMDQLKDIVAKTLEAKGVLGTIRAQLRAAVFTALDDQERANGIYLENSRVLELQQDSRSVLLLQLLQEFFEFYELDRTLSVFLPEVNVSSDDFIGRERLASKLGSGAMARNGDQPLLMTLLNGFLDRMATASSVSPPPIPEHNAAPMPSPQQMPSPVGSHGARSIQAADHSSFEQSSFGSPELGQGSIELHKHNTNEEGNTSPMSEYLAKSSLSPSFSRSGASPPSDLQSIRSSVSSPRSGKASSKTPSPRSKTSSPRSANSSSRVGFLSGHLESSLASPRSQRSSPTSSKSGLSKDRSPRSGASPKSSSRRSDLSYSSRSASNSPRSQKSSANSQSSSRSKSSKSPRSKTKVSPNSSTSVASSVASFDPSPKTLRSPHSAKLSQGSSRASPKSARSKMSKSSGSPQLGILPSIEVHAGAEEDVGNDDSPSFSVHSPHSVGDSHLKETQKMDSDGATDTSEQGSPSRASTPSHLSSPNESIDAKFSPGFVAASPSPLVSHLSLSCEEENAANDSAFSNVLAPMSGTSSPGFVEESLSGTLGIDIPLAQAAHLKDESSTGSKSLGSDKVLTQDSALRSGFTPSSTASSKSHLGQDESPKVEKMSFSPRSSDVENSQGVSDREAAGSPDDLGSHKSKSSCDDIHELSVEDKSQSGSVSLGMHIAGLNSLASPYSSEPAFSPEGGDSVPRSGTSIGLEETGDSITSHHGELKIFSSPGDTLKQAISPQSKFESEGHLSAASCDFPDSPESRNLSPNGLTARSSYDDLKYSFDQTGSPKSGNSRFEGRNKVGSDVDDHSSGFGGSTGQGEPSPSSEHASLQADSPHSVTMSQATSPGMEVNTTVGASFMVSPGFVASQGIEAEPFDMSDKGQDQLHPGGAEDFPFSSEDGRVGSSPEGSKASSQSALTPPEPPSSASGGSTRLGLIATASPKSEASSSFGESPGFGARGSGSRTSSRVSSRASSKASFSGHQSSKSHATSASEKSKHSTPLEVSPKSSTIDHANKLSPENNGLYSPSDDDDDFDDDEFGGTFGVSLGVPTQQPDQSPKESPDMALEENSLSNAEMEAKTSPNQNSSKTGGISVTEGNKSDEGFDRADSEEEGSPYGDDFEDSGSECEASQHDNNDKSNDDDENDEEDDDISIAESIASSVESIEQNSDSAHDIENKNIEDSAKISEPKMKETDNHSGGSVFQQHQIEEDTTLDDLDGLDFLTSP